MHNDFLDLYDNASPEAKALWNALEAVASDIESAPQGVLEEVMRLTTAWGAEPSTAQGVVLGAAFITYLHRLGGHNAKAQSDAPRDIDRVATLIMHRCFQRDSTAKLAVSDIMPAVRACLADDPRLASLAAEAGFSVAPNNFGYRRLKLALASAATRITKSGGKTTLHGLRVKGEQQSSLDFTK